MQLTTINTCEVTFLHCFEQKGKRRGQKQKVSADIFESLVSKASIQLIW